MISYVGWDYCGISHGSVVMWYHILMVVLRVVIVEKRYLTGELVQAHVTRGGVCLSGLIVHHFGVQGSWPFVNMLVSWTCIKIKPGVIRTCWGSKN